MQNEVGVIGVGFVGGATCRYFESKNIRVRKYDKYKNLGSVAEVNEAEAVFVCVPTPYLAKGGFDLSFVEAAIKSLNPGKIVIIKSSVVPGTTEKLQKKFPQHKFLFNPEFLREVSAFEDFVSPDRQIIGYTAKSKSVAQKILKILPKAPYAAVIPSREAEIVKYMANSFLALRVVFANEFYDICRNLGADYEAVLEAVGKDPRIGDSHFSVAHGGYRGYGGSCFPKDVNAIIQMAESKKLDVGLLKAMRKINRKLLKQSGLDESFFLTNKHKTPKK